ncbi:GNAT family N-acetyltransferase [Gloeobacter violaceus]|uniref:Glr2385 protein n=1 Tax=Gloeobacter violaceus (strain ATCC 29082 / PCC 7421) TaxID=251221 RepID=Q7NHZ9_GLOVI|nr:GNAT family N-acetyltransferase [Gloeobacter violaceus]BAC90326.1 glr2385 [Gloeobacter violaceus PCC 7421]
MEKTVSLRPTAEADLDFVLAQEQSPNNRPYIRQWSVDEHRARLLDPDWAHLVIESEGEAVGYVILHGLRNSDDSLCLKRIVVARKGEGFGRRAVQQVKRFAFDRVGSHRLWLEVKDFNTAARHLYRSEGFVAEGIMRESARIGERYDSLIVMSILEQEYRPPTAADCTDTL